MFIKLCHKIYNQSLFESHLFKIYKNILKGASFWSKINIDCQWNLILELLRHEQSVWNLIFEKKIKTKLEVNFHLFENFFFHLNFTYIVFEKAADVFIQSFSIQLRFCYQPPVR